MKNKIDRIKRILEDLIKSVCVNKNKFLEDFQVSESTLKRDFNKVVKYIAHEDVVKSAYGIDSAIELKQYIINTEEVASKIVDDDNPTNQAYLENLFSQINKLPKRNDVRYKEIENFKKYEMTYCIVNEMAIRNKRVAKLIKVFHKLASFQDKKNTKVGQYKQVLLYNTELSDELKNRYERYVNTCNIDSKKNIIDKIYSILKNDYMVAVLECNVDGVDYIPGRTYTTLQSFVDQDIKSIIEGELRLNTNRFNLSNNVTLDTSNMYGSKAYDGFILEQKKYNNKNDFKYSIIEPSFTRSIMDNNVTSLAINFALPKDEIMAYISHIIDSLHPINQDKKIKTSEELTVNEFYSHSITKLKNSEIANYFFIYDFVSKRRDILKKKYIQDKDKEIEYDEDVEMELIQRIFQEKLLTKQTKLDTNTIKRYYYTMHHFIDKLEYRELINSALILLP